MLLRTLVALSFTGLLTGCALGSGTSVPTAYPVGYLPTVIFLTAQSIESATVAARPQIDTPAPTATLLPPTLGPSPTSTPGLGIPLSAIQINAPGPMSRIVSPLQVQLLAKAADSQRIEVDLFGEDGRLLGRTLKAVVGSPDGDPLSLKIPFEIRLAAGEKGYVQVSTTDLRGVIQSLVTVQVLLLSDGTSQVNPAGNTIYERVALSDFPPDSSASGGVVALQGQILPYNLQPVILELISNEGKSIGTRVLTVSGTDWQHFSTTIPYKVAAATPARLYVHQADDVLSGPAYVFSQPVLLNP